MASIIIMTGALAWLMWTSMEYRRHGGNAWEIVSRFPLIAVLAAWFSRAIHWYCHIEQYDSFIAAMTNYEGGGYVATGIILAVLLVGLLHWRGEGVNKHRLDVMMVGASCSIAIMRLNSICSGTDLGKVMVTDPAFQCFPFAGSSGIAGEYHVAVFMIQFVLLMAAWMWLMFKIPYKKSGISEADVQKRPDGELTLRVLVLFSLIEILTDSMRYDASFMPINGFVSFEQVVSALTLLAVLIVFTVRAKRNGVAVRKSVLPWVLFWLGVGGIGGCEYLVQRHGNWYLSCYTGMTLACLLVLWAVDRERRNTPDNV